LNNNRDRKLVVILTVTFDSDANDEARLSRSGFTTRRYEGRS